ncbi:hypothetical protein C0Q70_20735 [Pomacea canaliculata]|uniref:F-box domain-containing protein n=2 Tax=Pomacea canaliculata TaxID=400727 RepID=A0A2T7NGE2_POMCA|nr:hypothetical protein C0Q70_20735 [Pomacea canaliculata]
MEREIKQSANLLNQQAVGDLPKEVLMHIISYLPTETLAACVAAHVFNNIILDEKFLDMHTRNVLGFPSNYTQITHSIIPPAVLPVQELWFQTYLAKALPNMVSSIRSGCVFYDLLCFKHLLESWLLQAVGFKFTNFAYHVAGDKLPPLPISKLQAVPLDIHIRQYVTKMALCCPEILLKTINNFEVMSITMSSPSDLDDPWTVGIPLALKTSFTPHVSIEVVLQQKGLLLTSFLLVLDANEWIGWTGLIDYSTFRCLDTWQTCKFGFNIDLADMKVAFHSLFQQLLDYVGTEYVSVHCSSAFFFRGIHRLMQPRQILRQQMQAVLEREAARITKKISTKIGSEQRKELITFLDALHFMPQVVRKQGEMTRHLHLPSRTLEVAIQRYTHRVLNNLFGAEVLNLYSDPACHVVLCNACSSTQLLSSSPARSCLKRVSPQNLPLRIWPLHIIQVSVVILPALSKLVGLDMERWRRGLHNQPLTKKIKTFARQVLQAVDLDFDTELSDCGPVVKGIKF